MNDKPNYYAVIPAPVRYDKRLTSQAKLIYGEISALSNKEGYCWATNKYFADLYDISAKTVSRGIQELLQYGYIEIETLRGNVRHIFISPFSSGSKGKGKDKKVSTSEQKGFDPLDKNVSHNNIINNLINTTINIDEDENLEIKKLVRWMRQQIIKYFGINLLQGDVDIFVKNIKEFGAEWVVDAMREAHRAGVKKWSYVESILKNRMKKKKAADLEAKFKENQKKLDFKPITKEEAKETAKVISNFLGNLDFGMGKKTKAENKQDNAAGKKKASNDPKYAPGTNARREAEREFREQLKKESK